MVELHDEDICRVKADIERQKKMCAELERACKNMVSEIWQQATKIDALMLEADKPLTNGALKKENMTLKEENERLKQVLADCEKKRVDEKSGRIVDMMRPQPCVRFRNAGTVEWIAKLMEETNEAIQEAHNVSQFKLQKARERLAMKLTDVVHVCVSWLNAEDWDEEARGELHRLVNEKNRARGYW